MPVIGYEDEVFISIGSTTAGNMPRGLQRSLAQQRAPKQDLLAVTPVDVILPPVEACMVHKHVVHPVNVPVKVPNLRMGTALFNAEPRSEWAARNVCSDLLLSWTMGYSDCRKGIKVTRSLLS